MTVKEAEELCKLAHKNQWRNPREMTNREYKEFSVVMRSGVPTYILASGLKVERGNREFSYDYTIREPYYFHPYAVADMMSNDEEKILALLHDIIEDTEAELTSSTEDVCHISYDGVLYPIGTVLREGLEILTRGEGVTYMKYIEGISLHKDLVRVKIADIVHNLSTEPKESMKKRYLKAMKVLIIATANKDPKEHEKYRKFVMCLE